MVVGSIKKPGTYQRVKVVSGVVGSGGGIVAPSSSGSSVTGTTKPTQTPTYNPETQTYTDEYGNKQSRRPQDVPIGTETTGIFSGTRTSSGGCCYVDPKTGKGYEVSASGVRTEIKSTSITTQTPTLQQQSQQPQPLPLSITPQKDLTLLERAKGLYYNIRYGDIGKKTQQYIIEKSKLSKAEEEERKQLEIGFSEEEKPFTKSGRGTIVRTPVSKTGFKPATEEEIVDLASEGKISEKVALAELSRREQKKYGSEYNLYVQGQANIIKQESQEIIQEKVTESQKNIQEYKLQLQEKVNAGTLKVEEANKKLNNFIEQEQSRLNKITGNLNIQQQQKLENKAKEFKRGIGKSLQESSKRYLKLKSEEIKFEKLPKTFLTSAVIGAGVTAGALALTVGTGGVAAPILAGVGYTGLGIATASASYQLGASYGRGTLTGKEVANVVVPFAGFYVGSKAVSGAYNLIKTNQAYQSQNRLRGAIERSEIKSKVIKGITTERAIAKLQIPENQKIILQQQLKAGGSIKIVEAKIKPINELDKTLINKNIPFRDIKFLVVTDANGNVINSVSVGRVVVGKGKTIFREDIISGASGVLGKSGEIKLQRITLGGREGQFVTRATKTFEVIKPKTKTKGKFKIITGESITGKAGEVIKPEGITYEDLASVARSQYSKAISKSKFGEVLKLGKTEQLIIEQQQGLTKDIIITGKKVYSTEAGVSVTERIIEPIIIKPTSTMKPFKVETPKVKEIKTPTTFTGKQIQQTIKNAEIPTIIDTTSIKSSLVSAPEVVIPKPEPIDLGATKFSSLGIQGKIKIDFAKPAFDIGVTEGRIPSGILEPIDSLEVKGGLRTGLIYESELQNKREKELERELEKNKNKINNRIKEITKTIQPTAFKQPQIQQLRLKQIQKQQKKISQQTIQLTTPGITQIKIPKINIPRFPKFEKQKGIKEININKIRRKIKKSQPVYTASLGAAAFQEKPVRISKKELERLSKVSYSGLETRPVLEVINEDNKLNKKVSAVQF